LSKFSNGNFILFLNVTSRKPLVPVSYFSEGLGMISVGILRQAVESRYYNPRSLLEMALLRLRYADCAIYIKY
jgi:hypothetical protein